MKFITPLKHKQHVQKYNTKYDYDQSYLIAFSIKETFKTIYKGEYEGKDNIEYSKYQQERKEWMISCIQALEQYCNWVENYKANLLEKLYKEGIELKNILSLVQLKEKRLVNKLKIVFNEKYFPELYLHT